MTEPSRFIRDEIEFAQWAREQEKRCHSDRDGDCTWGGCPQLRDGEPAASGRSCPLWTDPEES